MSYCVSNPLTGCYLLLIFCSLLTSLTNILTLIGYRILKSQLLFYVNLRGGWKIDRHIFKLEKQLLQKNAQWHSLNGSILRSVGTRKVQLNKMQKKGDKLLFSRMNLDQLEFGLNQPDHECGHVIWAKNVPMLDDNNPVYSYLWIELTEGSIELFLPNTYFCCLWWA